MPEIAIDVEAAGWGAPGRWEPLVARAVKATLAALGIPPAAGACAELSVLLSDDAAIRALNAAWRGADRPTNILAFPMLAPQDAMAALEGRAGPALLGDLVLAHETIAAEAKAAGIGLEAHVAHLLVHGMLHLLGHDHEEEAQAAAMEALETRILATLGIADPYNPERVRSGGAAAEP